MCKQCSPTCGRAQELGRNCVQTPHRHQELSLDWECSCAFRIGGAWFRPSVRTPLPNYLSPVIWADWTLTNCRVAGRHSVHNAITVAVWTRRLAGTDKPRVEESGTVRGRKTQHKNNTFCLIQNTQESVRCKQYFCKLVKYFLMLIFNVIETFQTC